jgi:Carboxypeptidase regulatory-like domain
MPQWLKFVILALVLFLLTSIPLAMQFENGSIEGFITDQSGPVAGASVEGRNRIHGDILRTTSDATGHYKLWKVGAGAYSLWVQAEGHDSVWIERVTVEHGQAVREDVGLCRTRQTVAVTMRGSALLRSIRNSSCAEMHGDFSQ